MEAKISVLLFLQDAARWHFTVINSLRSVGLVWTCSVNMWYRDIRPCVSELAEKMGEQIKM
jgi:hypothetical protein